MAENKREEYNKAMRKAILEHRHKMETDPEYREEFEKEFEEFKKELHFFREHPDSN